MRKPLTYPMVTAFRWPRIYAALAPRNQRVADAIIAAGFPPQLATTIAQKIIFESVEPGRWTFDGSDDGYGYADATHKRKHYKVHRVLCRAFHGLAPGVRMDACHNDSDPSNLHPSNLRWDTRAGNFRDKIGNGTHNAGERHPFAKLTAAKVASIRAMLKAGATQKAAGAAHGVTRSAVLSIHIGRAWRCTNP